MSYRLLTKILAVIFSMIVMPSKAATDTDIDFSGLKTELKAQAKDIENAIQEQIDMQIDAAEEYVTDKVTELLSSLKPTQEQQKRIDHMLAAYEQIKQASSYIKSISELFTNSELTLPVGLDRDKYLICIDEMYIDSVSTEEHLTYIKAMCKIPFGEKNDQFLAFEGIVLVEGDKGMGTHGKLDLIMPFERSLGKASTIVFKLGSYVTFGCDGFEEAYAKLSFAVKTSAIYCVDDKGKSTGRPLFDMETRIADFDDFFVSLNVAQTMKIKGLDDFKFTLKNIVVDQSYASTPATATFPKDYFSGENATTNRNMWRGVAVAQANLTLPAFIKNEDGTQQPIQLNLSNVIFDGNGFSCTAHSTNIIDSKALKPEQWGMSVDTFNLNILRNHVTAAAFSGDINIPPFGNNSLLNYKAGYDQTTHTFILRSNIGGKREFPILCGNLTFNENSTIEIKVKDTDIYPTINANGVLSIIAPVGKDTASNKLMLPDLKFEGLRISREKPYFDPGIIELTGKIQTPEIAGFQLTINELKSIKDGQDNPGMAIDAIVGLTGSSNKSGGGSTANFTGEAGLNLYGNQEKWKFNKVEIGKIKVDYQSNAFSLNGEVEFKDNDEIYGKGFRGAFKMNIIKKFDVSAVAVFGKKDDYRYFLTDAFFEASPPSGVLVPPALNFYGIGGGLYRHMQQDASNSKSDFGKSLSGINYIPDKKVGMGFMARTKFGFSGSPTLFDADVSFEMQFNDDWGVNFIQLRGDATLISPIPEESMLSSIKKGLEKVENATGDIVEFDKSSLENAKPTKEGALQAKFGMMFDIEHDVFSADLNTYLNVANVLTGCGPNNSMGEAAAYFSKDKWYTYIGQPESRLGVQLLGIAKADGYFMTGSDVPELPNPPEKVLKNLSSEYRQKLTKRSDGDSKLTQGAGLAFGAGFECSFKGEIPPFYASIGLGIGSEFLLKKYGDAVRCAGRSGQIGINGWYAQLQAWAWAEANIGMQVRLFRKTRKFDIISASMGAFLRGSGPNPFYFTGAVGGQFRIMGGLIKGHCSFDFDIGEKCVRVGGSPFGEDVIAQITPDNSATDVNVFVAPQLVLNIPTDTAMVVEDEETGKKDTYRVTIAEFFIQPMCKTEKLSCSVTRSDDARVVVYEPYEPLESQTRYKIYAKVAFERLDGSRWEAVRDLETGENYYEEKLVEFTSGDRPKYILPEDILYAYPADRQYNFLAGEYDKAYLIAAHNYDYLFTTDRPEGFNQEVHLTSFDGQVQKVKSFEHKVVSYSNGGKFEINIPISGLKFKKDEIYNLSIVNVPIEVVAIDANVTTTEQAKTDSIPKNFSITETTDVAEGDIALLDQTDIYNIDFRTSSYSTIKEKMGKMEVDNIVLWQEHVPVFNLISNIHDTSAKGEMFDQAEYDYSNLENSIVHLVPNYDNMPYYTNMVKPLIYGNTDVLKMVGTYTPPVHVNVVALGLDQYDLKLTDSDKKTGAHGGSISTYGAINNHIQRYMDADYMEISTKLANKLTTTSARPQGVVNFMKTDLLPNIVRGAYPVKVKYILPGKGTVTSEYVIKTNY